MTPSERTQRIAAGDPRATLLANTPPDARSEVAARYDHEIEARELDSDREPTTEELEAVRMQWWRTKVARELAEPRSSAPTVPPLVRSPAMRRDRSHLRNSMGILRHTVARAGPWARPPATSERRAGR